jgi:hypothetical protein
MARKIMNWLIAKAMVEAGIITEEQTNNIYQMVIHLKKDGLPVIYIEMACDENILKVFHSLDGVQVVTQKDGKYEPDAGDSQESERVPEGEDKDEQESA